MVTPSQDQNEPITFVHYGCLENSDLRPQMSPKLSPPKSRKFRPRKLRPPPPPFPHKSTLGARGFSCAVSSFGRLKK